MESFMSLQKKCTILLISLGCATKLMRCLSNSVADYYFPDDKPEADLFHHVLEDLFTDW